MNYFSSMQKVLSDGTRYVVSKRGGKTIIQKFWANGVLAETKVKKIAKEIIGSKKVITKDEFVYHGEPYYVTGAVRRTTDRVYDESSNLIGIRRIIRINEDSGENNLHNIIEKLKND